MTPAQCAPPVLSPTIDIFSWNVSILIPVPDPHLPTPTLWTLGMNYSLTCVLSNLQSYAGLDVLFRLEIRGPDSTLRASQSTTSPNISCYFSPLVVSDGGNYTCNGTVFVMEDNSTHPINSAMTTITVESESPLVALVAIVNVLKLIFSIVPFAPVPEIYPVAELTYAGSRLFLNCTCTVVDALPNQTMVDMLWYKDNNLLLNKHLPPCWSHNPCVSHLLCKEVVVHSCNGTGQWSVFVQCDH